MFKIFLIMLIIFWKGLLSEGHWGGLHLWAQHLKTSGPSWNSLSVERLPDHKLKTAGNMNARQQGPGQCVENYTATKKSELDRYVMTWNDFQDDRLHGKSKPKAQCVSKRFHKGIICMCTLTHTLYHYITLYIYITISLYMYIYITIYLYITISLYNTLPHYIYITISIGEKTNNPERDN